MQAGMLTSRSDTGPASPESGRRGRRPNASPAIVTAMIGLLLILIPAAEPQPGDVYREFVWHSTSGRDWRVTDPAAVETFPRAAAFLPNPVRTIRVADLRGATRAELTLDRWNGHRGSINKRVRFNGGDWLDVPPVDVGGADLRPAFLMTQDNTTLEVPISQLVEGDNALEATCDEEGGFGWGQWGFYAAMLRVYYGRDSPGREPITGRITVPAAGDTLADDQVVRIDATAGFGVTRIDVLAEFEGYDVDGDGRWREWQSHWHQPSRGEPPVTTGHVGTLRGRPYELRWDTRWVPDQDGPVRLVARVRDSHGFWFVTDVVGGLTLSGRGVELLRPLDVPEDFGVREDRRELSCRFQPLERPEDVAEAALHFRSWHGYAGHHRPLDFNGRELPIRGNEHFFDYDRLPLPAGVLRGDNVFTVRSDTEHHQLEVLWPGPAVVVRRKPAGGP